LRCLHCGKPFKESDSLEQKEAGWHSKCVRSFFGTRTLPTLEISDGQLLEMANAAVNRGLTVPGVQKKLSLHLSRGPEARLTIVDYPTGYILKPQTTTFESLPEFEDLAMRLADAAGIRTVPHALVRMDGKEEYAYITKRVDREIRDDGIRLYAMEDFCQLSNRLTQDKYRGSYESCGKVIREYSDRPGLDLSELFLRVALSFLIGNSDLHLKNLSLREMEPASRRFGLSGAYDLLPVNVILPEDEEELALTLNGKKRSIRRKDFVAFAEKCGIPVRSATGMLDQLCFLEEDFLLHCGQSLLTDDLKVRVKELIQQRIDRIRRE
jgi:serine/threonine-protein kinase HipA